MTETTDTAATAAEDTSTATPPPEPATDPAAELEHWKTMARKQEQRAKENAAAAQRLAELEDAQKTEQQRLEDRAAAAEAERDTARQELTRLRMAARYGIGEDDLDLLGSGTDDEIEARAKRLSERLTSTPAVPGKPTENLRAMKSGATGHEDRKPTDGDWFRSKFVPK